MITDYPVKGFPMKFSWQEGKWEELFNEQINFIKEDVRRAKVQGRLVIYLSCPISSRGGGYSGTNVEITEYTRMKLLKEWGLGFWILNPANYQMESKGGTGLLHMHARKLWGNKGEEILKQLIKESPPKDGDYMRMWTKVLVEDEDKLNLGYNIDGFYFLAPSDVRAYFLGSDNGDLTASIQNYFSRKYDLDSDFRDFFTVKGIGWGKEYDASGAPKPGEHTEEELRLIKIWDRKRLDFFRFYSLKASMNYSPGGHDEWNIWYLLNELRIKKADGDIKAGRKAGIGELIPAYFDTKQVTPADFVTRGYSGYEQM